MANEIVTYMQNDIVRERFSELMGERNAAAYISSVLLTVAQNDTLSKCTPASIYTSALRAATIRLSVDAGLGQAYLVPFGGRATLIIGYKGLYDLAVRTGRYRYINVGKVYEGEQVVENRISGLISLEGGRKSDKVVGYIGAFEMTNGFAKTIYMTVEEIDAHAKQYSKNYGGQNSLWKTEREKMEKKTVLRILLRKWGYFDPADARVIDEVEAAAEIVEGETTEEPEVPEQQPEPEPVKHTIAENMFDLGFDQ
jgi:recombination protein RecT